MPEHSKVTTQSDVQISVILREIYRLLFARYGPQHWWPGETPFEVMVGAILTHSCAWTNVEKAFGSLKSAGLLSPEALRNAPQGEIAALIHSCGYYNVKAKKLKALVEWLKGYCGDDIDSLSKVDTVELRKELLNVYGIGEETADSILLYACGKPVFVIDAYTRRILNRLGVGEGCKSYTAFQALFMENLPLDRAMFNEYHALLVRLGKETCRKVPQCEECCLEGMCRHL
jgi:endonuclease-3 related protein